MHMTNATGTSHASEERGRGGLWWARGEGSWMTPPSPPVISRSNTGLTGPVTPAGTHTMCKAPEQRPSSI